jgi:uncharacterized protein (DUF1330 family)
MHKYLIRAATVVTLALSVICHAQAQTATTQPSSAQPHGYMIVTYDIKDQTAFQQYMDAAGSLAAKYNGKVIVFNMKTTAVEGKSRSVIGIVDFPNLADAKSFYYSPEYTSARKFRARATKGTSTMIITEGLAQQ